MHELYIKEGLLNPNNIPINEWLIEYTNSYYAVDTLAFVTRISFQSEEDAMAFKMVWSDYMVDQYWSPIGFD